MKRNFIELASIIGLTLCSVNLQADILIGPGGAWQPWTAAVLGPDAAPTYTSSTHPGPYWNNFSGDGPTANIGWCLTGGGGCVIATPPGAIAYYGTSTGAAVQNMALVSGGWTITATLLGQLTNQLGTAANPGYNVFGWYTINPNGTISATPLWNSKTDTIGQTISFNTGPAGTQYGLYLENIQGSGTSTVADYFWFMNSSSDYSTGPGASTPDTNQHFAVFCKPGNDITCGGTYYIGVDDTNNGNQDFNNMIIELATSPEPSTYSLVGLGLACCWLVRQRKHKLS
jgi:hypothetical protein